MNLAQHYPTHRRHYRPFALHPDVAPTPQRAAALKLGALGADCCGHLGALGQLDFALIDPGYGVPVDSISFDPSSLADFSSFDVFDTSWTDLGLDSTVPTFDTSAGFDTGTGLTDQQLGVDYYYGDTGGSATGNIGLDTSVADESQAAAAAASSGGGFTTADIMNLVKGGLTVYQAIQQIQAGPTAAGTTTAAKPPAGYYRTASGTVAPIPPGYVVNPATGQLVRATSATGAAGATPGAIIPGVPNWLLLAGGGLAAFMLLK